MKRTRVAVIGVGYHGRHHARIFAAMPEVELTAVVDANPSSAKAIADAYGTRALPHFQDLLGAVDAVSIAVPTVAHAAVAREFLKRGVATLVEKPLAYSVEEAAEMVYLAEKHGALLQVGHIERYNPCWEAATRDGRNPTFVQASRLSRYPFRSLDVSVVFDVMIHDLDLILSRVRSRVAHLDAVGERLISPNLDWAEVRLGFANGCHAHVVASRVHHETVRQLRLWSDRGLDEIDFLARKTTRYHAKELPQAGARAPHDAPTLAAEEKSALLNQLFHLEVQTHEPKVEPLRAELDEFVACVREGRAPKVTGEDGYAAVVLASRIEQLIGGISERAQPLRRSA